MTFTHMRIAKAVTDLELTCRMYCDGMGLQKIAAFSEHDVFAT